MYANTQGMEQIKSEFRDKNLMQKKDSRIKPVLLEDLQVDNAHINMIRQRYKSDPDFKSFLK